MSKEDGAHVRVIRPEQFDWREAATNLGESEPAGREATMMSSIDDRFSFGVWQRDQQSRHFERSYHEVALILEGEVEITEDDGAVHVARAGDVLVTPRGSKGHWRNLTPVRKVWAVYEEASGDLAAYIGPGGF
jgi:uncharacterized protein